MSCHNKCKYDCSYQQLLLLKRTIILNQKHDYFYSKSLLVLPKNTIVIFKNTSIKSKGTESNAKTCIKIKHFTEKSDLNKYLAVYKHNKHAHMYSTHTLIQTHKDTSK